MREIVPLEIIREKYKPGTLIHLTKMDDFRPVEPDSLGYIDHVDDGGIIHVNWFCGSSLGLVEEEDDFEIVDESTKGMLIAKANGNILLRKTEQEITYQQIKDEVEGYIEHVSYDSIYRIGVSIYINEEGKLIPLDSTMLIVGKDGTIVDYLVGPVLFVADDGEDNVSLNYDQIVKVISLIREQRKVVCGTMFKTLRTLYVEAKDDVA